jgi:subfamily B ATP-binding cassette protein HlyB/CyaB
LDAIEQQPVSAEGSNSDAGLAALCAIAAYYRIAADPGQLRSELALAGNAQAGPSDLVRAAQGIGMKARIIGSLDARRLASLPKPALISTGSTGFRVLAAPTPEGRLRLLNAVTRAVEVVDAQELAAQPDTVAILVARRWSGPGVNPASFGWRWFFPSLWRYRKPTAHVFLASLFIQLFALVTPLFFQVVIDKVLTHHAYSTLVVLVVGLVLIGLFDVVMQYLRTYALTHTTSRIDVELGQRLFAHLLKLPVAYFETRPTGQTVARFREIETIRQFMTGQGLFAILDLLFATIFVAVLFAYSTFLALIVVATIPLYILIAVLVRPALQAGIEEKFNRGAASQQFLVESIIGAQTIKASAVEPIMRLTWEEKLAAYVRKSFDVTLLGAGGQLAIQYVNKASTILLLFFGARAVIDNELTVGELIAFNMIAGQVAEPVLRLSQLWQDFQQVRISIDRLGDILNAPPEPTVQLSQSLPPPKGEIEFRNVAFAYAPESAPVLLNVSLKIAAGEVIGIVGPSGSGKSSLTKLVQRLYLPQRGQILMDGMDLASVDPLWLRRHTGVVLQENLLFNRTIHENIALANPAMPRQQVIAVARLAGAHEFVARMTMGYDTVIEERGTNLSGGQRQRLAIARALATNPRILILDEATSALDYESERIIQQNMRRITRGRTVIIVAHRLAAVSACDRIVGMADGQIVEQGTHDELVNRNGGLYARLWALQTSRAA